MTSVRGMFRIVTCHEPCDEQVLMSAVFDRDRRYEARPNWTDIGVTDQGIEFDYGLLSTCLIETQTAPGVGFTVLAITANLSGELVSIYHFANCMTTKCEPFQRHPAQPVMLLGGKHDTSLMASPRRNATMPCVMYEFAFGSVHNYLAGMHD